MLLPQTREREYRFRLALRMVLPIFALVFALILHTFITNQKNINISFYVEATLILFFSIYFIFYLIYKGFDTKITDNISKTFTREYIYDYLDDDTDKLAKEYAERKINIKNGIIPQHVVKFKEKSKVSREVWFAQKMKEYEGKKMPKQLVDEISDYISSGLVTPNELQQIQIYKSKM